MATWAKVKFFWETMLGSTGSTLAASSTASGDFSVNYLFNMLETNRWMAAGAEGPHYITYDAGAGNTKTADYLVICGHNLRAAGALVSLERSSDNFVSDISECFTPFVPQSDTAILTEFAEPSPKRHWRLKLTGAASAPYMALCIWGKKTELDYATASFDPHAQEARSSVNLSYGGFVAGIHTQYVERAFTFAFDDADAALYSKISEWWEKSGQKNFFAAWETANNPQDVFLVRPDKKLSCPLKKGGLFRDVKISLKGRKE